MKISYRVTARVLLQVITPKGAVEVFLYWILPFAQSIWSLFILALALFGATYASAQLIDTQVRLRKDAARIGWSALCGVGGAGNYKCSSQKILRCSPM